MKDKKQHKKGESVIGKIIYGFLLFMPLFAIGITCLVNTFNMSAKEESEVVYKYETNEVNSSEDLIDGNIYHIDLPIIVINQDSELLNNTIWYEVKAIYNIQTNNSITDIISKDYQKIYLYKNNSYTNIMTFRSSANSNISITYELQNSRLIADFVYIENNTNTDKIYQYITKAENKNIPIEYVKNKDISNTFYKAIEQVENSNLFNWAKNSIIYTGLADVCITLQVSNTFIPMLMTYWLIISVLYFLYDIILMMLLLVHEKIHDLQESI